MLSQVIVGIHIPRNSIQDLFRAFSEAESIVHFDRFFCDAKHGHRPEWGDGWDIASPHGKRYALAR